VVLMLQAALAVLSNPAEVETWSSAIPWVECRATMTAAPGALVSLAHVPRRHALSRNTGSCAYGKKQLKSDMVRKQSSV
jgi:hypothetical protein